MLVICCAVSARAIYTQLLVCMRWHGEWDSSRENIEYRKVGEVESSGRHLDDKPWIKIEHYILFGAHTSGKMKTTMEDVNRSRWH